MRVTYINLLGEEHPLCFSFSAIEEITDKFGGMSEMQEVLFSDDLGKQMKAVGQLLAILLKAGRRHAKLVGLPLPKEIEGDITDLLGVSEVATALTKVVETTSNDSSQEIDAKPDPKNTAAMQE